MWSEEKELLEKWLQWKINDSDLNSILAESQEWDSFNIVQFMAEMEHSFKTKVTLEDLDYITTVNDLLKYINERKVNNVSE